MNTVYFGSSEFGIPSLEMLHKEHKLLAVVTNPDKPKGRNLRLGSTPIKKWADLHKVPAFQPHTLTDPSFQAALKDLHADFFVLISYGHILPAEILTMTRLGCLNVHPSLLPCYRGAAPIEWTLLHGETVSGITIILMNPRIDAGAILMQKDIPVSLSDNFFSLSEKLMALSPKLLKEAIIRRAKGEKGIPQKGIPSHARKVLSEDGRIWWGRSATEIHNKIRGLVKKPGAFTIIASKKGSKIFKIKSAMIENSHGSFGEPGNMQITKKELFVFCGKGILKLLRVQLEGKKELDVKDFIAGNKTLLEQAILK